MDLEVEQEGIGPVEVFYAVPKELEKYVVPSAVPVGISGKNFEALMQEFRGDGFSAWYSVYCMKGDVVLKARGNIAVLELRIALRNMIRGTWEMQSVAELPECYFQLGFTPHVATRAVFGEGVYETFDIQFTLSFLEKLGIDYRLLGLFIEKVIHNNPAELIPYPFRCTPRMKDCVYAVLRNHYTPAGKKRLLRNAVTAVLLEALEEVASRDRVTLPVLKQTEIDKLHIVKEVIETKCPLYPGSVKLCMAAGINEFLLNYGFKHLFNTKPYEYYQRLRFAKAKELLREGHTVVDVAHALEYAAASPFITKFREMFGYTPKEFQMRGL